MSTAPTPLSARLLAIAALLCGSLGCSSPNLEQTSLHHSEGPPLAYIDYQVLFTNPDCKLYPYAEHQQVQSVSGQTLTAKPQNAFCTKGDAENSGSRPDSPQYKLIEWIEDPATEEIFFGSMSFSNELVRKALCKAVRERNVKVRFVLDRNTNQNQANQLLACQAASGDPADAPEMFLRGHEGNISLHHNKIIVINPQHEQMRIAFGSGNISSGLVLHHENWHFITVPRQTFFAQAHLCLMNGVIDYGSSKGEYSSFIRDCKAAIEEPEESDIKTLFVPGEGGRATQWLLDGIKQASAIDIAAHRFTHSTLVNKLRSRLSSSNAPVVRFVGDDDLYWAGHGQVVGGNEPFEFDHVSSLSDVGMSARYLETNHDAHLLHHNKSAVFSLGSGDAVFCGAGNFTKSAMRHNYENFYFIRIESVVAQFREQFEHLYHNLATTPEMMPADNILPPQG